MKYLFGLYIAILCVLCYPINLDLSGMTRFVSRETEITKEQVIEYIQIYSNQYGVDPELALQIAKCESEYYYKAQNPHSTAQGVFQMIDSTWEYTMKKMGLSTTTAKIAIPISIEAGIFLLKHEGKKHWNASKRCWSKIIN